MTASSQGTEVNEWERLTEEAQRDRRRERRLNLAYPIELYGFDHAGRYFTERTVTQNVSPNGCRFEVKRRPEPQGVLAIRVVTRDGLRQPEHKPLLFQVCWVERSGRRWAVGVRKLQPGDMWGVAAPAEASGA